MTKFCLFIERNKSFDLRDYTTYRNLLSKSTLDWYYEKSNLLVSDYARFTVLCSQVQFWRNAARDFENYKR